MDAKVQACAANEYQINKSMYIFFHELKRGKLAQVTTNNSISTRFGFYLINRQATLK
jgi:hypothetical protein